MIPYGRQNIDADDIAAVTAVLQSDFLTQGPAVPRFEEDFAQAHGVAYAIAVSNATAALHIGCIALGVSAGSRVWTSPNSFVASANCALYCGATIDFVDIDPHTRNMSVAALEEKLRRADQEGALPQVVIPVDFAGLPVDLAEIRALADRYEFRILEDASHAVGASYRGRAIGGDFADASVFSFHPVKIITTGEGGVITTNDPELAARLRLLRSHGITRDKAQMTDAPAGPWSYEQVILGYNYRLTDLQAALGSSQLRRLEEFVARRRTLAKRYTAKLEGLPLLLPVEPEDRESAWHLYAVQIDSTRTISARSEVFAHLRARGVGVNVHYIPIHSQPYFRRLGFVAGQFPEAERYYASALSLPLFPQLSEEQQDIVVEALAEALTRDE